MSRKRETIYLHGYIYWAKIFGSPRPNYDGDAREWSLEFEPDSDAIDMLTERGLADRLKTGRKADGTIRAGYEDRSPFLNLRRNEFDFEGKPNEHIRVVDAANQPWDDKKLLGNKTEVDLKINIVDYGPRKKAGIYPQAIRVLELVPYVSEEFKPLDDDDPRVKKARANAPKDTFREDFDLADPEPETEQEEAPETESTDEPETATEAAPEPIRDAELDDDMPV